MRPEHVCPRGCGPMFRRRHPNNDLSFLICNECDALCYGHEPGPLPEDQYEMFLSRFGLDFRTPLIESVEAPNLPSRASSLDERVEMLRSNGSHRASELGRLLGGTTHYGPTYVLLLETFHSAFPKIPADILQKAVLSWRGVGGSQSDEYFDQSLALWLDPNGFFPAS